MSSEGNSTLSQNASAGPAELEATSPISLPPPSGEVVNLLASMETLSPVVPGDIVQGKVLKVTGAEVLVDIGLKSEAVVPLAEFLTEDGQLSVGVGHLVDLWVDRYDETTGTISVSRRKAARSKAWEEIERAFSEHKTIRGRVVDRIKGGLTVDIGILAFLPGSQADIRPHCNLDAFKGQEITCKVIKVNQERNNAVVSRKAALEEELDRQKARLLEQIAEGGELVGRVKNLTDYGVFVDLGGMDGLLHITDLSWGRVAHPSEVVQVGQQIKVKVLKYDPHKGRISLGMKQLSPDPWERVGEVYHPGDRFKGRVASITDYGAFVELEPGVEGLIHISEMTWGRRLRHPSKIVNVGDRVEVVVLDVNRSQRRISLSLKHSVPDPWTTLAEKLTPNSVVEGRVRNLTDFGAFVEIADGVDGLIHLSNLSWSKGVKHPSEILKKGQKVQALVLSLDTDQRRLSLGLKQLQPDLWMDFFTKTRAGDVIRGKVSRLVAFGAFVELVKGVEGLCHTSEFGEGDSEEGATRLVVGSELDFRVIRLNREERKIGLSRKNLEPRTSVAESGAVAQGEGLKQTAAKAGVSSLEPSASLPIADLDKDLPSVGAEPRS